MEPSEASPSPGSIENVSQRLVLWARRAHKGLVRVEYSSEFSRQEVCAGLRRHLTAYSLTIEEIVLPSKRSPDEIVAFLLEALNRSEAEVVSIVGFATAFSSSTSLPDALQVLNFNRERLTAQPLRQIWWMTPVLMQVAIHAMPDLNSWFSLRLSLTETLPPPTELGAIQTHLAETRSTANIDDARQRAHALLERFATVQMTGATEQELLTTFLLPALEALADVGAQKELQDLTLQFEGWLGRLKLKDSVTMAAALSRLAQLYRAQGRYGEAEPLFQQALEICRSQLGEDHPDTATTLNNLGALYESQGRYGEAEPLYQQALEIRRSQLGEDHPDTATSLNNLGMLYLTQGRYGEAEPLFQQALKICRSQLGEDHPNTATILNNLAGLYESQGRYGEAELFYTQTLSIWSNQLGKNHPNTKKGWQNFVYFLQQVIAAGRTAELSDHPLTRELVAWLQER
ncbi:MAG: tetratricopeptide repeat protein [Cyanophyceae cyanobacterium]